MKKRFRVFGVKVWAWGLDVKADPVSSGQFDALEQAKFAENIIPHGPQLMVIDFVPQKAGRPTDRGRIVHLDIG